MRRESLVNKLRRDVSVARTLRRTGTDHLTHRMNNLRHPDRDKRSGVSSVRFFECTPKTGQFGDVQTISGLDVE